MELEIEAQMQIEIDKELERRIGVDRYIDTNGGINSRRQR